MTDTSAPVLDPGAAPDPAAPRPAALAFTDADSARRWANTLPMTGRGRDVRGGDGPAEGAVRRRFPAARAGDDRRGAARAGGFLHTELARRYAGKSQPAGERELEAAEQAIALWNALWEPYSACLKPLLEGDADLAGVKPKLLQRGLFVGKQLLLVYGLARRVAPPSLWQELHAYYRLAEMLECAVTAVSDDLMPNGVGISCYSTYSHALLLGLADPCAMTVKQVELADRWLQMWSRKVFPYAQQRETEGPVIVVDLEGSAGATLDRHAAAPCARVDALRLSGQARHQRPRTPEAPADGRQPGGTPAWARLQRRAMHDAARLPRPALVPGARGAPKTCRAAPSSCAAAGCRAAYFRVGGRTFERRDPLGRLTFQGAQHLQTLGALTDYDRGREDSERTWAWETLAGHLRVARGAAHAAVGAASPLASRAARRPPRRRAHAPGLRHAGRAGCRKASSRCRCASGRATPKTHRAAAAVLRVRRRPAAARAAAAGNARGQGGADPAAADVQPQPRPAFPRRRPRAQVPPHPAAAARLRLRAGRVRGDELNPSRSRRVLRPRSHARRGRASPGRPTGGHRPHDRLPFAVFFTLPMEKR